MLINSFVNWESIIIVFILVIWIGSVLFLKFGMLHHLFSLRFGVLVAFIIVFLFLFFFLQSSYSITGVVLPLIWTFVDSYFSQNSRRGKVTLILKSRSGYSQEIADSIKAEFEQRLPSFKLKIMFNAKDEDDNEIRTIFHNEVRLKPDAIILMLPAEDQLLISTAIEALQKGIILITIDFPFDPHEFIRRGLFPPPYAGADFDAGGRLAARAMFRSLNGKKNIAIISGPFSSRPSQIRKLAFIDELLRIQQNAVIVASRDTYYGTLEATQQMTELLESGTVIDGLFCCTDHLAMGAVKAVKKWEADFQGHTPFPSPIIIGFDGLKEIYQSILDGDVHCSIDVDTKTQSNLAIDQLSLILTDRKRYYKAYNITHLTIPRLLSREVVQASLGLRNKQRP